MTCSDCYKYDIWNVFDCDSSRTCQRLEEERQTIAYAHGEVSGILISEQFFINNQAVVLKLLLVDEIKDLNKFKGQGLLGLGRLRDSEYEEESSFVT